MAGYEVDTSEARRRTELYLGGFIANDGEGLALAERHGLKPGMFRSTCAGRVYSAALALRDQGIPVSFLNLLSALADTSLAMGQSNEDVLAEMLSFATTLAQFSSHAKFLKECHYKAEERAIFADLATAIDAGDADAEANLRTRLKGIERERSGAFVDLSLQAHSEFLDTPHEPPPAVIEGLFNRGEVVMLASDSKAGKSWFLLQAATCIGSGLPFLGNATVKGAVIYLNLEISERAWWDRCRKQSEALGIVVEGPDGETDEQRARRLASGPLLYHACARGLALTTDNVIPLIHRAMETRRLTRVAAVVVDPYYTLATSLDENSAGEVAGVMLAFQRLAEELDAAVVIAHHYAKGNASGKKVLDRSSGSGAFGRSVDTSLNLTQSADKPEEGKYTFEVVRRNAKSPAPKVVRFEYPLWFWLEEEDVPDNVAKKNGRPTKWNTPDVTARMEPGKWYSRADLVRRGLDRHKATELLMKCLRLHHVVKDEAKDLYRLPEAEELM